MVSARDVRHHARRSRRMLTRMLAGDSARRRHRRHSPLARLSDTMRSGLTRPDAAEPLCAYCRQRPVDPAWRPFCSERCKLADLGRWLRGYRLPMTCAAGRSGPPGDDEPHVATRYMADTLTITDNRTGQAVRESRSRTARSGRWICARSRSTPDEFGMMTYDPAFTNTAACRSRITFIDGDKGILLYRGYPIEQLAEQSDFLETAYLDPLRRAPDHGAARRVDERRHASHDAATRTSRS